MSKSKEKNMGNFIGENWELMLGGGAVTSFFGWVFYGRKNNNIEYTTKVQAVFERLQSELEKDRDYYKKECIAIKEDHKQEVAYFRSQLDDVRKRSDTLQGQFNKMTIAYTNEVEVSQNWEKLHRELNVKYNDLYKSHEDLKIDHEKLKRAFNTQQKTKTPRVRRTGE